MKALRVNAKARDGDVFAEATAVAKDATPIYGSGSDPARAGSTGGAVERGGCDGAGFMTGMKGGFDDGSRVEGGDARSTTVISPAAWER